MTNYSYVVGKEAYPASEEEEESNDWTESDSDDQLSSPDLNQRFGAIKQPRTTKYGSYLFYGLALNFEWMGCVFPELAWIHPDQLGFYEQSDRRKVTNLVDMYQLHDDIQAIFQETDLCETHLLAVIFRYADLERFDRQQYDYVLGRASRPPCEAFKSKSQILESPFQNRSLVTEHMIPNVHMPYSIQPTGTVNFGRVKLFLNDNEIQIGSLEELLIGFQEEFCWLTYFDTCSQQKLIHESSDPTIYERQFILGCLVDSNFDNSKVATLDLMKAYQIPELFRFQELVAINPRLAILNFGFIHYEGYLEPYHEKVGLVKDHRVTNWELKSRLGF